MSRNKANGKFRNRTDEILFIDARNMGHLINRRTRELSEEDIQKIAGTYHNWRSSPKPIFRLAYENQIIEEVENWFEYAQARIDTAHDYNEEKYMATLEKTGDFIRDAIELNKAMTKESW